MKAEGAGVWWASMPFGERIKFQTFADNQELIEERWTSTFGDRLNEIVFIGINIDQEKVTRELDRCICNSSEIALMQSDNFDPDDDWPIERQFAEVGNEINFHS